MIRSPLDLILDGNLLAATNNNPLYKAYQPFWPKFAKGMEEATRAETRAFKAQHMLPPQPTRHVDEQGTAEREIFFPFSDGSSLSYVVTQEPNDGPVIVSVAFLAKSKEAMSALLDIASAGLTEIDSAALAANVSK